MRFPWSNVVAADGGIIAEGVQANFEALARGSASSSGSTGALVMQAGQVTGLGTYGVNSAAFTLYFDTRFLTSTAPQVFLTIDAGYGETGAVALYDKHLASGTWQASGTVAKLSGTWNENVNIEWLAVGPAA